MGVAAPVIVGADVLANDDGAAAVTDTDIGLEGEDEVAAIDAGGAHGAGAVDGEGAAVARSVAARRGGIDGGV